MPCLAPYLDRKPPLPALLILRLAAAELLIRGRRRPWRRRQRGDADQAREKRPPVWAAWSTPCCAKVAAEGPERLAHAPPQRLPGWIGGPVKKRWGAEVLRHHRGRACRPRRPST